MKALVRKLGNIHPDHQRIFKGAFRVAVFLLLGKAAGVFGVTSVLLPDGDLYWGREHFPTLIEMLRAKR